VTSTIGITHPRPVDLLPPTLQTIPEAVGKNIAIARARTRSRIMAVQVGSTEKAAICAAFAEPSDGLEPSTPSLPWNDLGNWSQPTATVLPSFRDFPGRAICYRLPPVAPAGLHKGSILCSHPWLRRAAAVK
jgi:hypothetical protein